MAHARSARPLRANDVRISSLSGTLILLGLLGSAGPGLASQGAPQPSRRTAPESNDGAARLLSTAHGLLGRGLHDLAAAEYERFLADWPGHDSATTARYGLAVCLHRMERYEAALGHLDPLGGIAGFPYAPEVALLTGACRLALGSNREAAAALRAFQRSHAGHASPARRTPRRCWSRPCGAGASTSKRRVRRDRSRSRGRITRCGSGRMCSWRSRRCVPTATSGPRRCWRSRSRDSRAGRSPTRRPCCPGSAGSIADCSGKRRRRTRRAWPARVDRSRPMRCSGLDRSHSRRSGSTRPQGSLTASCESTRMHRRPPAPGWRGHGLR